MKSGIIYLGPDEMASKHKIRVNLKIGTKNTRIGVPRELEGWMKTTLYRDTLRWILFEDRVAEDSDVFSSRMHDTLSKTTVLSAASSQHSLAKSCCIVMSNPTHLPTS